MITLLLTYFVVKAHRTRHLSCEGDMYKVLRRLISPIGSVIPTASKSEKHAAKPL
jgi:hypothetical protein